MARAASTYVVWRTWRALLRTTSSARGAKDRAMATTRFAVPLPRMATIAMARTMRGKDTRMSVIRWITKSTVPPKYADATPTRAPTVAPARDADSPTSNAVRAPKMRRLRMSRPKLSVPSQCRGLGGLNMLR
ncbi:hypothetical protein HRbin31_00702 [bacterium HR31]|nr:hypothetical protein HRbin31_00702 [bacterium HR31]